MDSTANRLTGHEIAQLISEGRLCPFPKPHAPAHRDDNAALVNQLTTMSREQQQAWLAERRKERAALRAAIAEQC
jgi:hypothetical protein